MIVTSNFYWMLEELLIFFLNINWHGMKMVEFKALMWCGMFMVNLLVVLSFWSLAIGNGIVFMNHASEYAGNERRA